MAKVVVDEQEIVAESRFFWLRPFYIGAVVGVSWWIVWNLFRHNIVDDSQIAGALAAILAGLLGVYLLVRSFEPRPLVSAILAAAILWGLGAIVNGLGYIESLLWSVLLYGLSYVLFGVLARYRSPVVFFSASVGVTVVILLALILA